MVIVVFGTKFSMGNRLCSKENIKVITLLGCLSSREFGQNSWKAEEAEIDCDKVDYLSFKVTKLP